MNSAKSLEQIKQWCKIHPGIFSLREEGKALMIRELYSQKNLTLRENQIHEVVLKQNTLRPNEDYLLILMESGKQLVLAPQGFAFAPDFSNTGPLPLPSQVYCFRDYQDLFEKLKWVSEEPDRRREALDMIMILIAVLDGARNAGLEVGLETQAVEKVLSQLEG